MKYKTVETLILNEQKATDGKFVEGIEVEDYIDKIKSKSELITHYISGECAGFIAFYCNDPSKVDAFVTLVLVSPDFRGQGISKILLNSVLNLCTLRNFKACSLEVRNDNCPAIRLYRELGFFKVKEVGEKVLMKIELN